MLLIECTVHMSEEDKNEAKEMLKNGATLQSILENCNIHYKSQSDGEVHGVLFSLYV